MVTLEGLAWTPLSTAWLWAIAATLTALVGLRATIRIAADNERIVVLRQGRPHRVRGPGPVLLVPALDRGVAVSVAIGRAAHRCVRATTCDGGAITVQLSLRYRITDPERAVTVHPDPVDAVIEVVERTVEQRLRSAKLSGLAQGPVCWAHRLAEEANAASRCLGVAVLEVEFTDVELQLPAGGVTEAPAEPSKRHELR